MKLSLSLLFSIISFVSNAQFFTAIIDSNFENSLISLGYDNILDGAVLTSNIDTITYLDIRNKNISDLTGINNFSSLEYLDCSNNYLVNLNFSQNNSIRKLNCSSNNLEVLLVNNLNNLDVLNCSFNNLINLNLSSNTELDSLECSRNQLTNLDLNSNLGYLYCGSNNLTSLDLSTMTFNGLHELRCENNPISNLDLSGNTNLKVLSCHNNLLQEINLSQNNNLEWLSIGNNTLYEHNNNLTNLDLSNNCFITNFYCYGNINLNCIQVCNTTNAYTWLSDLNIQHYFSNNCNYTSGIENFVIKKEPTSIIDVNGRKSSIQVNSILLLMYKYGKAQKKVILYK